MDKKHISDQINPPNHQIPPELMEEINNLKKQNANSTFQLLRTQKMISDFKNQIEALENKIDGMNLPKENKEVDQVIQKLNELKRFL